VTRSDGDLAHRPLVGQERIPAPLLGEGWYLISPNKGRRTGNRRKTNARIFFVGWPPTLDFSPHHQSGVGSNPIPHPPGSTLGRNGVGFEPTQLWLCRQESNLSSPTLGRIPGKDGRWERSYSHRGEGRNLYPSLPTSGWQPGRRGGALPPCKQRGPPPTPLYIRGGPNPRLVVRGEGNPLCIKGAAGNPLVTKGLAHPPDVTRWDSRPLLGEGRNLLQQAGRGEGSTPTLSYSRLDLGQGKWGKILPLPTLGGADPTLPNPTSDKPGAGMGGVRSYSTLG